MKKVKYLFLFILLNLFLIMEVANTDIVMAEDTYVLSYHVGEYSLQTDTNGNVFAIIDGKKYNYAEQWDGAGFLQKLLTLENQNVVYELHDNEIVKIYTIAEVLAPKVVIEPSVKEGLIYQNGKFSQKNFDLTIRVSNYLQDDLKNNNLYGLLSSDEKERLTLSIKSLSIKPSDDVNFGTSGWWVWKEYQREINEECNDKIKVGENNEYKYNVNLEDENALTAMKEYNINLYVSVTYDIGIDNKECGIKVGNLDYQEKKTEEKKQTSNSGKVLTEATTTLTGIKNAVQFTKDNFSSTQINQINQFVNAWISELILAKHVDKSSLKEKVTEKIASKWLKKLGLNTSVLTVPGEIRATTFLETETKSGEKVFIQFDIDLLNFEFGNTGMPTMATGTGSATVYNREGKELDSSVIAPAYVDVCAFCEQLQKIAKSTIFNGGKEYLGIFGINAESTAEALSSKTMTKLLNSQNAKNVFKMVDAKDMKSALKTITTKSVDYGSQKIYKLLTTPSKVKTEVSVKCPVDVKVYDNDGNVCGIISNNQVDCTYSDIYITVVGEQKNIYLVGDDYTFELTGTDVGRMDYIVKEFDENGNTIHEISYTNVKLTDGCKYYSYVPEIDTFSSTLFDLTDEKGDTISPTIGADEELKDENDNTPIIDNGTCGENLTWTLDGSGVLRITGTGKMYDFEDYYEPLLPTPWKERKSQIKYVLIDEGVTSIGNDAFYKCRNLRHVYIPDTVTSIGSWAFAICCSLESIVIPESVDSIGENAFNTYIISKLKRIIMRGNAPNVGNGVFEKVCAQLIIPENAVGYDKEIWMGLAITSGNRIYGKCGDNLTWELNENGVLKIEGSGDMYSFHQDFSQSISDLLPPWDVISNKIIDVVINAEIACIEGEAFAGCGNLTRIKIPVSVTSIGDFTGCSSLTHIDVAAENKTYSSIDGVVLNKARKELILCPIGKRGKYEVPEGVVSIGDEAFLGCSKLESIAMPEGVMSIGNRAFEGCIKLASIEIPNSVNSIAETSEIFADTEWIKKQVDDFVILGKWLLKYQGNEQVVVIPEDIEYIGSNAFEKCSSLTSIEIPEGVVGIGDSAFENCVNLINITVPDSVTSVGRGAVDGTGWIKKQVDNFVILGRCLLRYQGDEKMVVIPNDIKYIGSNAFEKCSSLTSIEIPEGVVGIGDSAFRDCDSLKSIEIPERVTSIGDNAFRSCDNLTSIELPERVTSIGYGTFSDCSSLISVKIPEGVKRIGTAVFWNCRSLIRIEMPRGVTSIENEVFWNCDSLKGIEIPEGVTSIGDNAFCSCDNLTSIEFPEGVTYIGDDTFYDCSSLTSVKIPEGVKHIGRCAFSRCSGLENITVDSKNTLYDSRENCNAIIESSTNTLILGCKNTIIPEGVASIDDKAFMDCSDLTSVKIPESVTSIGSEAFCNCDSLVSISIPKGVASIENGTFYGCSSLTSINIPKGVMDIETEAFEGCSSLTSISIPGGVTGIGSETFKGCSSLANIKIPESVTRIGYGAFFGCSKLLGISIPEGVADIGDDTFSGCSSLTNINIPKGVTRIGSGAFFGCSKLLGINIPESVTDIGDDTFSGCSSLTSINIPESATGIGSEAFKECSSLTNINIPESVTDIGSGAFCGCSSLTSVSIPDGVTSIGVNAFRWCSGLESIIVDSKNTVYDSRENCNAIIESSSNTLLFGCENSTIPEGITGIGNSAFEGCSSLTSISIPKEVTSIGNSAFKGCSGLEKINVNEGNKIYDSRDNCNALIESSANTLILGCKNTKMPKGITSIGDSAFACCNDLINIKIPEGVTSIGENAFYECSSLESIEIPISVIYIDSWAFNDCENLTIYCFEDSYAHEYAKKNDIGYSLNTIDSGLAVVYEETVKVKYNGTANLEVKATSERGSIRYQWYYGFLEHDEYDYDETYWGYEKISDATSSTLSIKVDSTVHPKYKCVVTDGYMKKEAYINLDTDLALSYNSSVSAKKGTTANLEVTTNEEGENVKYQWYRYDEDDLEYYIISGETTNSLSVKVDTSSSSKYKCEVTDGIVIRDAIISFIIDEEELILSCSPRVKVKYGDKAHLSVNVLSGGNGDFTCQWYYYDDKTEEYVRIDGEKGWNLDVIADKNAHSQYKCEVKDSVSTAIAYIKLLIDKSEVKITVQKVQLKQKQVTIAVGDTLTLKAVITPATTTDKVSWKTSNKKLAAVSSKGKVVAKKAGKVTIMVTVGTKKATCKLTIKPAPRKITLNKAKIKLKKGKSIQLKYTITKGSLTKVTFTSSNKKIAMVNSKGKVVAKRTGKAVITAKTSNGKRAKCQVVVVK